jgi:hypothetical protein
VQALLDHIHDYSKRLEAASTDAVSSGAAAHEASPVDASKPAAAVPAADVASSAAAAQGAESVDAAFLEVQQAGRRMLNLLLFETDAAVFRAEHQKFNQTKTYRPAVADLLVRWFRLGILKAIFLKGGGLYRDLEGSAAMIEQWHELLGPKFNQFMDGGIASRLRSLQLLERTKFWIEELGADVTCTIFGIKLFVRRLLEPKGFEAKVLDYYRATLPGAPYELSALIGRNSHALYTLFPDDDVA